MTGRRVAIVTGANRGTGLEVCSRLAASGQHVVLGSPSAAAGEAAARSLAASGLDVEPHPLDVTNDESVRALIDHVEHALRGADVLINNAGLLLDENGDVLEVRVQHFRDCMETNVHGPLRLAQALMPGMITRRYGRVANVSSGAGQISTMRYYAPPYSLSKAALFGSFTTGRKSPGSPRSTVGDTSGQSSQLARAS